MKKRQKNKRWPSNIGRRTGVDVVQGKKIRKQDDGTDVFEDYWSDSVSIDSNQTSQSIHSPERGTSDKISENVSILNRDSVSYKNSPRSCMKKTSSVEYEDPNGYFRPEHLKKLEVPRKKLHFSEAIGRRTGLNVVQGKKIRKQDDGTDVYDDYLTDNSNEVIQSLPSPAKTRSEGISENVPIFERITVSFMKTRRSSLKENHNQRSGEFEDHDGYSSPEQSRKLETSDTKIHFLEDEENSAIARSKMTQTSRLLDETESTLSKSRIHLHKKSWKSNVANVSDSNIKSSVRKSPKILSNASQTPNRREDLPSTRDSTSAARVSLSGKIVSEKKDKDNKNSKIMTPTSHPLNVTRDSPLRNRTYTPKTSYSKETEKNWIDSSDSEKSSSVESSNILSHESNRREGLPSSRDDTAKDVRISLSSKMEPGKTKDKRNSRVMTPTSHPLNVTRDSPLRNRTYTPKTSYSKETEKNRIDSSDSEKSSLVESSGILSHIPNRKEGLLSLKNYKRISLSTEMESGINDKNKRNSRVLRQTSHLLDETESSPFKNRTYTPKTSYTKGTEKDIASSSDSERNSPVENFRVLTETSHVSNRREHLPSSSDDTVAARVSLSSKMESKTAKVNRYSRVMSQTSHPLDGTEDSPLKNMADSCDRERNVSLEKCSEDLSKTSQNSKKEVKKRNSSLKELSQYADKSSEVLNQEENATSKNDSSASKSENLVSGQRENELKERNGRKSSMRKSPIAIKRKMKQIPDALENSPSKTSCVQNRQEEGTERNFSGEKSHNHSTRSSKMQNLKRNIYSTCVNRSEILVPYQKENDQDKNNQESSSENSPRATESRKVLQENASSTCNQRRSSRYRRPPLASWRNERFKFVKGEKGYECVGVEEGRPEDDYVFRVLKKRYESKFKKRKVVPWKKRKNIPKDIKKTPIINERTEKIVELYLHRPFTSYEWTLPPNEDNPGYMISRTFKSRFMTFGFLDIAGHSMKDKQHSPQDNLHFVVVKGVVEAIINTTSFTFEKGDSFIVPVGTLYSLSNETSYNALLCFTAFRIPFFTYQEKE
ncbi:unnamed protein product [Larinioides sclopetarius]|uniref:Mif2/CENP-C cupin domain-containing protein n=1 Tax=Larinioides sclopetarius TaxID=280406 RepID=A0AAV1Z1P3_9ARAC